MLTYRLVVQENRVGVNRLEIQQVLQHLGMLDVQHGEKGLGDTNSKDGERGWTPAPEQRITALAAPHLHAVNVNLPGHGAAAAKAGDDDGGKRGVPAPLQVAHEQPHALLVLCARHKDRGENVVCLCGGGGPQR